MLGVILLIKSKLKSEIDRERIKAYLILALTSVLFWMIYYTGPMGVTLFIKNNVDKHFLGFDVATQWLLNANTIMIIFGAPLLSLFISKYESRFNISVSKQFMAAFIMLAASFYTLNIGINFSDSDGYTSLSWVLLYFIFQGLAELLIAPVGLAMIGRIAPPQYQGLLMGAWMLVSGTAASLSHYFSNAMVKTQAIDPLISRP